MAFKLNSVVPWGRNIDEYKMMFILNDDDMKKKIAGFGDGPAAFNSEAKKAGCSVTSFDPIYQFSREQLQARIEEVRVTVMQQMADNKDNYIWINIKNLDELENIRMTAMNKFLDDYDLGKAEGRYIYHELPNRLDFEDNSFDIGLSSHFLLMYTALGYEFHINAIDEMLRVCREIRIFPLCDLDSNDSEMITSVIAHYKEKYNVEIKNTEYEFQKGANRVLVIRK